MKQALRVIRAPLGGKYETMFFTLAAFTPHFAPLVIVQVDLISLSTVAIPVAPFLY